MKWKNESKSITLKILKVLILFSISILAVLWLFQVIFLDVFYKYKKTTELQNVVNQIVANYHENDIYTEISALSYKTEMCMEILDSDGKRVYTSLMFKGCMNGEENASLKKYRFDFINSGENSLKINIVNPRFNNETLLLGVKLNDGNYLFANTTLEPINTTIDIIEEELIIISIIILCASLIISFFVSRNITKPIKELNEKAKEFGKGNYDVRFDVSKNISEINELATTLNYAAIELSKTEELRRELLANVSHDLKTPLTMIKAYSEKIRDLDINDNERCIEDTNTIIEEVDRLNLLVLDILEISKFQSNIITLDKKNFDLNLLINNVIKRFSIYQDQGYIFRYNCDKKSTFIDADYKRIEQVLYNLIINAINYTGKDKKIFIKLLNKNDVIRVEIKDTGKGIADEEITHIWDRYYKVDKNYTREQNGTGLGLSIVKSILDLHEFNYGVITKKGRGTTFYFEIKNH